MNRRRLSTVLAVLIISTYSPLAVLAGQYGDYSAVSFQSGDRTLAGDLYKPEGNGPFKAIIYNHGSNEQPGPFDNIAEFYNKNGFVFFLPYRTGHGRSPGPSIRDKMSKIPRARGFRIKMVRLLENDNNDVVAAVDWLKKQPFIDSRRIVMSGLSFGGIQTLLSAEKGLGVKAFISFAPAAMSWRNHILRRRLTIAIQRAKAPMFLIQAENDFSTQPYEVLGSEIKAKGPRNRAKLYPAYGSTKQEGHGGFASQENGIEIWGPEVLKFISATLGYR